MPTAPQGAGRAPVLRDLAIGAALLGLLFALLPIAPVQAGFRQVALGLAVLSEALLAGLGQGIERSGAVLRALPQGHAVEVTAACDGHGLMIAWAALLALLRPPAARLVAAFLLGVVAIQGFNLLRVLALFAATPAGSTRFDMLHYGVFPLLSGALLAAMGAAVAPPVGGLRGLATALAVATGLGALWLAGADALAAAVLAPVADALLRALAMPEVTGLTHSPEGWAITTRLIASTDPLAYRRLPIHPEDYALSLPLLLAAGAVGLAGRSRALLAGAVALAIPAALLLGSLTTVWMAARGMGAPLIALPVGGGQVTAVPYTPPGALVDLAAVAQNVIVHALLLVLPARLLLRPA